MTGRDVVAGLAFLLFLAAPVVVLAGKGTRPDAHTCALINGMSSGLGEPATCSTAIPVGYYVVAALLLLAGVGAVLLVRSLDKR